VARGGAFPSRLPPRRSPRGSQLVDDGAFRRPSGTSQLLGEFFELGASGCFALVGGDEVRPDRKQGFCAEDQQIAGKKETVICRFELLDFVRVGDIGRDGRLKKGVAADAGMPDQVALFLGEVDGEGKAIGGDTGSGEPSRGDLPLLALSIDPHAHVGKMLHSTAGFKLPRYVMPKSRRSNDPF